jgi:hypothetical protein
LDRVGALNWSRDEINQNSAVRCQPFDDKPWLIRAGNIAARFIDVFQLCRRAAIGEDQGRKSVGVGNSTGNREFVVRHVYQKRNTMCADHAAVERGGK